MEDKWIRKYMKIAKAIADDNRSCASRKIGVVLVSSENSVLGIGYNGSIRGIPHNDEGEYLEHLWSDLLDAKQRTALTTKYGLKIANDNSPSACLGKSFVEKFENCGTCPRRLLDIPSGQGLELCGCSHAERNAIFNCAREGIRTAGASIVCYCAVPCHECSIAIVQSGIKQVVCLLSDQPDYSRSSRWLLMKAGVDLIQVRAEDALKDS